MFWQIGPWQHCLRASLALREVMITVLRHLPKQFYKSAQQAANKTKSNFVHDCSESISRQKKMTHCSLAGAPPPSYLSAMQSVSRGRRRALSGSPVQGNHNSVYHLLPVLACHLKHLLLDLFKVDPQLEGVSALCMHISDQTQPGNSAAEPPPDKALSHCLILSLYLTFTFRLKCIFALCHVLNWTLLCV